MDTPTRRDFFRYAVGAALASALPVSAQTHRDKTIMPLIVDLVGPMVFREGQDIVEVWLPKLDQTGRKHEAGLGTPVSSFPLPPNNYKITGPPRFLGRRPTPYRIAGCTVYGEDVKVNDYSAKDRYIYLTLPMPRYIVALDPVSAEIYPTGSTPLGKWTPYAVGLRFLYDHAGIPTLHPSASADIQFEPADGETQLNMSIGYAPYDYNGAHDEAKSAFNALSVLFGLNLQVEFETQAADEVSRKKLSSFGGPLHNCKAPIMLLQ